MKRQLCTKFFPKCAAACFIIVTALSNDNASGSGVVWETGSGQIQWNAQTFSETKSEIHSAGQTTSIDENAVVDLNTFHFDGSVYTAYNLIQCSGLISVAGTGPLDMSMDLWGSNVNQMILDTPQSSVQIFVAINLVVDGFVAPGDSVEFSAGAGEFFHYGPFTPFGLVIPSFGDHITTPGAFHEVWSTGWIPSPIFGYDPEYTGSDPWIQRFAYGQFVEGNLMANMRISRTGDNSGATWVSMSDPDFVIETVVTVPEPSSLVLCVLGVIATQLHRKRSR